MKNTDLLENMLKLQQKLNDETNGKGWENGYTKEGEPHKLEAVHLYGVCRANRLFCVEALEKH